MVALLVFRIATLEIVFGRKKLLDDKCKGSFGGNVIKNPARYILWILPSKYQLSKIIRHV